MISFCPQVFTWKKIGKVGEDSLFEGMLYLFIYFFERAKRLLILDWTALMCHENSQAKLMARCQDPGTKARVCINGGGWEITCAETTWKGIYTITKKFLSLGCRSLMRLLSHSWVVFFIVFVGFF